jgi:glycosyltransferase involved in cell wall biosynthesis
MATLSIVIPAFNEERAIADIAQRVLAMKTALKRVGVDALELLVVDDGSKDRTGEIAMGIEGVQLIRHASNRGYGAALKTGFAQAQGELIGFLDADGTYPPEYLPQLCEVAMNGHDLAIGSRLAGAESHMPLMRRLGNLFFAALLSVVSRARVTDSASGMRVFKREIRTASRPFPTGST